MLDREAVARVGVAGQQVDPVVWLLASGLAVPERLSVDRFLRALVGR